MERSSVIHYMNESFQYKVGEHRYLLKLVAKKGDFVSVRLGYLEKYFREKQLLGMPDEVFYLPMRKVASTAYNDYYEAVFDSRIVLRGVNEKVNAFLQSNPPKHIAAVAEGLRNYEGREIEMLSCGYFFELDDGEKKAYYGNFKFFEQEPRNTLDMFNLVIYQAEQSEFQTPSWAKGAVIYQIFPERFAPTDGRYSPDWFQAPMQSATRTNGTLKGIEEKIPYLKKLGVDAIYLTPIFLAGTSHRYDSIDYMKVDPLLGGEEALASLVEALHKAGIRLILDLVFNHSSTQFFAFQDLLKNQQNSPYKDWYFISKWPVEIHFPSDYPGFSFTPFMPKLNTSNPACREYLLGVARHYLKDFHVDGYRLDVANEVSHDFWKEFRKECKAINPDCLIMGEIWYDSSAYLRGDEFDSVMNYTYFDAIRGVLSGRFSVGEFLSIVERERGETSQRCYHQSNLLLGSHDTDRIFHDLHEDEALFAQAMALLFTLPGSPILYYGDEAAMEGAWDPDCRRGMVFDENYHAPQRSLVEKLVHLKHRPSLQEGDIHIEHIGETMGYTRFLGEEKTWALFNLSDGEMEIPAFQGHFDLLQQAPFDGKIPTHGFAILDDGK